MGSDYSVITDYRELSLAEKSLHDIRRLIEKMELDGGYDTQMGPVIYALHPDVERAAYRKVQSLEQRGTRWE